MHLSTAREVALCYTAFLHVSKCKGCQHCALRMQSSSFGSVCAQYNKFIMIDRTFYGADEPPNPTGIKASEYDVITNTNRNLTSGIQTNSLCSAVRATPKPRCCAGHAAWLRQSSDARCSPGCTIHGAFALTRSWDGDLVLMAAPFLHHRECIGIEEGWPGCCCVHEMPLTQRPVTDRVLVRHHWQQASATIAI